MDTNTASKLIEEKIHILYNWCYSKLFDKTEAEDLSHDIIVSVLASVSRIENDNAFWKFFWRTAENVLHTHIRKKRKNTDEFCEEFMGAYVMTPEEEVIRSEQIFLLRRELSIMSKMYREVTVQHYYYGKSCSEIANELSISAEMVKFYLFKSRKMIKEGIGMNKEYGEKSYAPHKFKMNFWGGDSTGFFELFERKLPGNILLSAYDKPLSLSELSLELGVSAVYLEDEIDILEKHGLIKKLSYKYRTNIIILRDEFETELIRRSEPICKDASIKIIECFEKIKDKLRNLQFYGSDLDENSFRWCFINQGLYHGLFMHDKACTDRFGNYPPLSNGSFGFVFGHDNDYKNTHWNGFYGRFENDENTVWVSVQNYRILKNIQWWKHGKSWTRSMLAMCDAAERKAADVNNEEITRLIADGFIRSDNGILSPMFPVFTKESYEKAKTYLSDISVIVAECMTNVCTVASEMLYNDIPDSMKNHSKLFANIWYQLEVMALILENTVGNGYIEIPSEKKNLCVFGVEMI